MNNREDEGVKITVRLNDVIFLQVIFLILRLFNVITWDWFWVFLPVFLVASVYVITFLILLIIALIFEEDDDYDNE